VVIEKSLTKIKQDAIHVMITTEQIQITLSAELTDAGTKIRSKQLMEDVETAQQAKLEMLLHKEFV